MQSNKQKKTVTAIVINENAELSQIKITDEHALYKKIGLNHPANFKCQGLMKINKNNTIFLYAKQITKRGNTATTAGENKYKFPPPFNNSTYKGSCILLQHRNDKLCNLTVDIWNEICNKKISDTGDSDNDSDNIQNSDDDDDIDDDDMDDDDDDIEDIKTRYSANYNKKYKKKNGDDDDDDELDDELEDEADDDDNNENIKISKMNEDDALTSTYFKFKNKTVLLTSVSHISPNEILDFPKEWIDLLKDKKDENKEEPYMYTSELVEEEYV